MRHNAIIDRRKKDREAAVAAKTAEANKAEAKANANKASTLASHSSPVNEIGRNSVAELDSVCPKSPSKNSPTKMPSVAEWLLWGDDESLPQTSQPNHTGRSNGSSQRGASASPSRSPARSPQAVTPTISESHSFDNSQLDSHFYSEFTDDYTVDSFGGNVTLASSKEPGLFAHGLMAVGELFAGTPVEPVTPSPERRRKPTRSRTMGHDDDDSTQAYSTYAKDDSVLTGTKFARAQSETTATTASTSPSALLGESNIVSRAPVKYHNMTSVNIIESSEMEFEMSLETLTRIEI